MSEDVRIKRLTGGGRAAVAAWRVTGTPAAVDRFEREGLGLPKPSREGRVRLVRFGPPPGEESVYVRVSGGLAELHTHGGDAVADRVGGVGQWTSFADECAAAFARATTTRTAMRLARVCFGRLEAELRSIREAGDADRLRAVLNHTPFGLSLTRPRRVVLFGLPNAGKSALMNRLAGYERSIVADTPGVTRDAVTASTAVGGWPVELVDTAGLRDAVAAVEREGVARARRLLGEADLRVLVVDQSSEEPVADLLPMADLVVRHKCDLPDRSLTRWPAGAVAVSSRTGGGVEQFLWRIRAVFDAEEPVGDALFFVTERQRDAAAVVSVGPTDAAAWGQLLLESD